MERREEERMAKKPTKDTWMGTGKSSEPTGGIIIRDTPLVFTNNNKPV